ncbi:MAG: hypothetical protein EOO61_04490 [Hymenobacter sp.]|nr:MAG: hypothetical protein EOO61_04490 [Hymenobacter sp.]
MTFEEMNTGDKTFAVIGYATIVARMVDAGYDPLLDMDVLAALEEFSEEGDPAPTDADVVMFYQIHDALLNA